MNGGNQRVSYPLTGASIDAISERLGEYLNQRQIQRANILRFRLSMEEALLQWRERFSESATVEVVTEDRWMRPCLSLELQGEQFNPLVREEGDMGWWAEGLLSGTGLAPTYAYIRGVNVIRVTLPRPRRNPALSLFWAAAAGIPAGYLGQMLLSHSVQEDVIWAVLDPVQNAVIRMLNAVAGPAVFFTVLLAVRGFGRAAATGKSGKQMLLRFLLSSLALIAIAALVSVPVFRLAYRRDYLGGTQFSGVLDLVLQSIPNDVLSPFTERNSPQLILVALILGCAMLELGEQADRLNAFAEQCGAVVLVVADWVSRLAPYYLFILLVLLTWTGSLGVIAGLWKPLAVFLVLSSCMVTVKLLRVAHRYKLSPLLLARKIAPSVWIALKTASVNDALGETLAACRSDLGIHTSMTDYAMPLGLLIYMPGTGMATLLLTTYLAQCNGLSVSALWYGSAVFLTTLVTAAGPPVTGVGMLAYVALFPVLNMPSSALSLAVAADILLNYPGSAVNLAMLELELVLQAGDLGTLNRELLQQPLSPGRGKRKN